MSIDAAPLAKPKIRRGSKKSTKRTLNGKDIIPDVIQSVLGAKTFTRATREITEDERDSLSRVLRQPVDEWRAEFSAKLRSVGNKLLDHLDANVHNLKPNEIAFPISIMVDKHAALDGRSQVNQAAVNNQINFFGSISKDDLLSSLQGRNPLKHVSEPQTAPFQSIPEPLEAITTIIPNEEIRECKV